MNYEYEWVTEGRYEGKWEAVDTSVSRKLGKDSLQCYRTNEPGTSFRLVCKKVLNIQRMEVI